MTLAELVSGCSTALVLFLLGGLCAAVERIANRIRGGAR